MGVGPSLLPLAAGSTAAYLATSLALLHRPVLPWTRAPPGRPPPVSSIAHRGGAAEGYENTIEAFRRAVGRGAGMLELDVHLSKDQRVVVAHDQHLLRLAGERVSIRELDLASLPPLLEQVPVDFMPGTSYSDPTLPAAGRRLATLDEVLAEFPETQVNIDLKDEEAELVAAVAAVVRAQGAESRVVWGNFSRWTTVRCHEADPSVGLLFSLPSFLRLYLLFYTGLLPFLPLKESHLEIPMPSIFYDEKYRTAVGNVGLARLPLWVLRLADRLIMSPRLFRHLALRGVPTYLWVLNTEEEYARAFALGAAGVMTDHPSRLQSFLAKKNI